VISPNSLSFNGSEWARTRLFLDEMTSDSGSSVPVVWEEPMSTCCRRGARPGQPFLGAAPFLPVLAVLVVVSGTIVSGGNQSLRSVSSEPDVSISK